MQQYSPIESEHTRQEQSPMLKTALSLYSQARTERYFHPGIEDDEKQFVAKIEEWKGKGNCIGFVAGCFDLLHPNHEWYLISCKIAMVAEYCKQHNVNFYELPSELQKQHIASPFFKLIVTIDGDQQVAHSKGFNPNKGFCVRPIETWAR